jgi:L-cysteate sulfo-lyase
MPREKQIELVNGLVQRTAAYLGLKAGIDPSAVRVNSDYVGPGYGMPTEQMIEAVQLTAQYEGIFLDPVYTGKAMAGLISLVRQGYFKKDENVVFVHTGGSAGLFGYTHAFHLN